jgi:hypothetical protein
MRVLQELMYDHDGNGSNFRQVIPFVFGFIKILLRRFNFLISESNQTLESMRNPFEEIDGEGAIPEADNKSKAKRVNKRGDGAY